MENLHSGGSAAVIVTVCYGDFYVKSVQANCVHSVVAVTNFVSAKLFAKLRSVSDFRPGRGGWGKQNKSLVVLARSLQVL